VVTSEKLHWRLHKHLKGLAKNRLRVRLSPLKSPRTFKDQSNRQFVILEAFKDLEILWKFSWKYYFQWNFSWFMDSWKRRRLEIRALSSDCWPDEGGVWASQHEFAFSCIGRVPPTSKMIAESSADSESQEVTGRCCHSAQLTVNVWAFEVLRLSVYGTLHVQKINEEIPCQHTLSVKFEAYVWLYHLDPLQS